MNKALLTPNSVALFNPNSVLLLPITIIDERATCWTKNANFKNKPCIPKKNHYKLTFLNSDNFAVISLNITWGKIKAAPLRPKPHIANMIYAK